MSRNIPAKKSLGQNFLADPNVVSKIIQAAGITPDDTVLEIGPGTGVMTRELARAAGRVIAIELDERLAKMLQEELDEMDNLQVVMADALKYDFTSLPVAVKVVANLPYYISTPIITRLIEARDKISLMVLMLQKEVARRITAPPGGKDYGYLSVMVQLWTEARMLFTVPAGAFNPVPKVDSAVVTLRTLDHPSAIAKDYDFFEKIVSAAFSQRRKTLRNALRSSRLIADEGIARLDEGGIDAARRAETLSVAEFARLADFLFEFRSMR